MTKIELKTKKPPNISIGLQMASDSIRGHIDMLI